MIPFVSTSAFPFHPNKDLREADVRTQWAKTAIAAICEFATNFTWGTKIDSRLCHDNLIQFVYESVKRDQTWSTSLFFLLADSGLSEHNRTSNVASHLLRPCVDMDTIGDPLTDPESGIDIQVSGVWITGSSKLNLYRSWNRPWHSFGTVQSHLELRGSMRKHMWDGDGSPSMQFGISNSNTFPCDWPGTTFMQSLPSKFSCTELMHPIESALLLHASPSGSPWYKTSDGLSGPVDGPCKMQSYAWHRVPTKRGTNPTIKAVTCGNHQFSLLTNPLKQ